jgi:L-fuconolactonase
MRDAAGAAMPSFPIVDTHVHLYDPGVIRYAWMRGKPLLDQKRLMAGLDAALGSVEIEQLVWVEVGADPGQHLQEASFVDGLARTDARIGAMVAAGPLEHGTAVAPDLEKLAAHGLTRGIRRLLQEEPDPEFCLSPGFIEGVRLLTRFDLAFEICIYHHQLTGVLELVRRCPEVRFVLNHIAKPGIREGLLDPWRDRIRELARLPNVVCKLSGMITEADHERWTREQLRPYFDHVVECFGLNRVMFGSDWPVSEQTHRYATWVEIVEQVLAGCSEADLRRVFRDNAIACYRLS